MDVYMFKIFCLFRLRRWSTIQPSSSLIRALPTTLCPLVLASRSFLSFPWRIPRNKLCGLLEQWETRCSSSGGGGRGGNRDRTRRVRKKLSSTRLQKGDGRTPQVKTTEAREAQARPTRRDTRAKDILARKHKRERHETRDKTCNLACERSARLYLSSSFSSPYTVVSRSNSTLRVWFHDE